MSPYGSINMSLLTLIEDIGDDIDLLVRSDEWLEEERKSIAAELDRISHELRSIYTAQKLKRYLQQSNLVAVQSFVKDCNGEISDINISIMPLPDAKRKLDADSKTDELDNVNRHVQLCCWKSDGYEV